MKYLTFSAWILFTAILLASNPVAAQQFGPWSAPVNIAELNTVAYLEQGPAISKDGLSLYFQSDRPGGYGGNDLYVSQRASVNDPWGPPQNLGANINTSADEAGVMLSHDGHRLYFHSNRPGGFGGADIYVSRRHNKRDDFGWQPAENLGPGVNTAAQEQQPCVFEDDASGAITLYFTSNRPGGPGLLDIYASTLQPDETFESAVLVPGLSGPFNDQGPTIRRDGLEIIFPSNRPGQLGMGDLWVSTRVSTSDSWTEPVNLGPVVNSPFTDAQPELSFDGTTLYFNSPNPGPPLGTFDLWVTTRAKLTGPGQD